MKDVKITCLRFEKLTAENCAQKENCNTYQPVYNMIKKLFKISLLI